MNNYELLHDAYYGVGIFENGRGLQKHPRESDEDFNNRKQLAYYLNYTSSIVDESVAPIYKDEIARDYTPTPQFTAFLDDVDRVGTDFQDYVRRLAVMVKLYGVVYIVVDNTINDAPNKLEAIKGRQFPYLTHVLPQNIIDWKLDEKGQLVEFEYKVNFQENSKDMRTIVYRWTPQYCIAKDDKDNEIGRTEHNLGVVPIVQWFSRNNEMQNIKPPSEFLSIAKTNYILYNICNWHTQILRNQAFNILTMPDTGGGADELQIGTNNVLLYDPMANHMPKYIAPDSSPANLHTDQMERLIREMYRMSGLESVVGVKEMRSGVAKQWDFERTNQRLADFAIQCENAEERIIKLYELWTGENINFICEYPRDFKINDVADSLGQAQQALDLGFTNQVFKVEVLKKVLASYLPNIEPDIFDDIINGTEQALNEETQDYIYKNEVLTYGTDEE